jgi:hypothetical protein
MFSLLEIHLEAHNPARNIARAYHIELGHDLLGDLILEATNGRIGKPGRTRRLCVRDENGAKAMIREILGRRASAVRRLDTPYVVRKLAAAPGWTLPIGAVGEAVSIANWQ